MALYFAREMSLQFVNYLTSQIQASGREDMPALVGLVGLNFLCEIGWSAIWSFVLISVARATVRGDEIVSKESLRDFNQLIVEGIRSMAAVIWRLPFAIIPGLIELLRLIFVPHVVLLEPSYRRGDVDALSRSRQVLRRQWGLVLAVSLLSLILTQSAELISQGSSQDAYFWQAPGRFCIQTLVTLAITLISEVYLIAVFLRVNSRVNTDFETRLEPGDLQDAHLQLDPS